jgi:serine/threonine protein kinase
VGRHPPGAGTELLGRYRLESLLGRGGMGEVWRALDLKMRRPVAVKLLSVHGAGDASLLRRFRHECRTVASIRHEGIMAAYDMGADGDVFFLVMELLDGENLQRVINQHPAGLHTGRALYLAGQIADALAAAHAQQIVHRDVKPGNVMVLPGDRIKICDFGIARLAQATGSTALSTMAGTPAYMAPEQCLGEAVDGRTDLYALGCVLYAMLAGHPPFRGESVGEIVRQHLNASVVPLRSLRPEIPDSVDDLVLSLLAKYPRDRPGDAITVAEMLAAIRDGRAVEIDRQPPAAGPARPGGRPEPVPFAGSAGGQRGRRGDVRYLGRTRAGLGGVRRRLRTAQRGAEASDRRCG